MIIRDMFINHSDHRATGLTACDAVYPAARDRLNFPEQIAAGLTTHKVSELYIWGSEKANFDVDITAIIDTKVEALRAHRTQFGAEFLEGAKNRWRREDGTFPSSRFGESCATGLAKCPFGAVGARFIAPCARSSSQT